MFLLIAVAMGYLSATNAWVETQVRSGVGASYASSALGRMSAFGGLASWACTIPAAYFYSVSNYDKNFWDGLIFCACTFLGGSVAATLVRSRRLRYWVSPFALVINPALACLAYVLSKQ